MFKLYLKLLSNENWDGPKTPSLPPWVGGGVNSACVTESNSCTFPHNFNREEGRERNSSYPHQLSDHQHTLPAAPPLPNSASFFLSRIWFLFKNACILLPFFQIGHVPYTLLTTIIYKEASLPEIPEPTYKGADSVKSSVWTLALKEKKKHGFGLQARAVTVGVK